MATIINPILEHNPFKSTTHRWRSLFQPIQATKNKKSDFLAYLATPVLDYFVLDTVFMIDASIRLLNAAASLLKAAYLWTMNQQQSDSIFDKETSRELSAVAENIQYIGAALIAQIVNVFLSTASLITRPIASCVEWGSSDSAELSSLNANLFRL